MQRVSPASNTAGFEYTFVNKNQEHQLLKAPQRSNDVWAENIETPTGFNNFLAFFVFPQGICKKNNSRQYIIAGSTFIYIHFSKGRSLKQQNPKPSFQQLRARMLKTPACTKLQIVRMNRTPMSGTARTASISVVKRQVVLCHHRNARWWFQTFSIFNRGRGNDPIWRAYDSNGLVETTN